MAHAGIAGAVDLSHAARADGREQHAHPNVNQPYEQEHTVL
jgi:hypothetical protein